MGKGIKLFVIGARGFPDVQGGIETFSENFYPKLAKRGYDVTVLAIKGYGKHGAWNRVKFCYFPSLSLKALEKPLYNLLTAVYTIIKRPDIVHIHSIASGFFIFALKLFGLKVVARYNSRDYLHGKWNSVGKAVLKFSEKQFFLADHIVTNNRTYLDFLNASGRKTNLSYLPNGVEIPDKDFYREQFKNRFPELTSFRFILYAGRVTAEKNIELLAEVFMRLKSPDMKLVIAGGAAHNDSYFADLRTKYESADIVFLGKTNRKDLYALYSSCALFVFPSLHEGMPNVLLEAMGFHCNILVSSIPAHLQFGFDDTCYFDPYSYEDLSSKIVSKLFNQQEENFSDQLLAHDWTEIVNQMDEIHQKLIGT